MSPSRPPPQSPLCPQNLLTDDSEAVRGQMTDVTVQTIYASQWEEEKHGHCVPSAGYAKAGSLYHLSKDTLPF